VAVSAHSMKYWQTPVTPWAKVPPAALAKAMM
jgi:hypothetical protein